MDGLDQLIFVLSFILTLLVVGGLWWVARYPSFSRSFWRTLAIGWTLNLVGNLAWAAYERLTGKSLPTYSISFVDGFYGARYLLVWLAFWLYPHRYSWPKGLRLIGVFILAGLGAWASHYQVIQASMDVTWRDFTAGVMYPVMDMGLVYTGWARLRGMEEGWQRSVKGWVVGSLVAYGVANWINFSLHLRNPGTESILPTLFWVLSDLLVGVAVIRYAKRRRLGLLSRLLTRR